MNRRRFAVIFGGLLMAGIASGAQASAQPSTWAIDKNHTQVNFQIRHLGVSNVRGSISGVTGTLTWNEKDTSKSEVTATIDTTTVNTNTEPRDKHLKSPDFFNIEKFPTMTFKSTSVTGTPGKLKLVGDLTLAGVTKPITLDVDGPSAPIKGPEGVMVTGFSATGTLHRSDFNFGSKFSAPMLSDDVIFTIDVEAKQQ
jgi:polyisoprenoid-binding protein YceI